MEVNEAALLYARALHGAPPRVFDIPSEEERPNWAEMVDACGRLLEEIVRLNNARS